jgi:hypothetical protein
MTAEELQIEIEALCRFNGFLLLGGCEAEGIWGELCLIPVDGETDAYLSQRHRTHPAFCWVKDDSKET